MTTQGGQRIDFRGVSVEIDGRVGTLRLQRPPVNAIDGDLLSDLGAGLDALEQAGVDGYVFAGRPGLFSAGLDLPALLQLDAAAMGLFWNQFFATFIRLYRSPLCAVAAIDGHAPAGGTVLALTADHRWMTRGPFRMGLNEVAVGLAVPSFLCHVVSHLLGQRAAERLLTQGLLLDPEEALRVGFVDGLADPAPDDGLATPARAANAPDAPSDAPPLRPVEAAARAELMRRLAVPEQARRQTKRNLRAPIADVIEAGFGRESEVFLAFWFDPECQRQLRAVVARLGRGRQGG